MLLLSGHDPCPGLSAQKCIYLTIAAALGISNALRSVLLLCLMYSHQPWYAPPAACALCNHLRPVPGTVRAWCQSVPHFLALAVDIGRHTVEIRL
jgi:hypothetical protein